MAMTLNPDMIMEMDERYVGDVGERNSPVCVLEVDIHFLCRTEELWNTNKVEHELIFAANTFY